MPARVSSHYDYTVHLEEGTVRLKIARMTPNQYEAFNAKFQAIQAGRGRPQIPEGASEDERFAAELQWAQSNEEWTLGVFETYVTVVDGDFMVDGEAVTSGRRFVELCRAEGGHILAEVWAQNGLTAEQKKTWRLQPDSGTGSSTAPSQADHGPRPEPTATSAESANSAAHGAATAPSKAKSSGSMVRSSSSRVRSARSRRRPTT